MVAITTWREKYEPINAIWYQVFRALGDDASIQKLQQRMSRPVDTVMMSARVMWGQK